METLRMLVKSVLVIIMLASFLEIVLPRSDIKRYVNLIIGLFVIIAVLNPFLSLVNKDFSFDVLDDLQLEKNSYPNQDTQTLIRKGQELVSARNSKAVEQYEVKLSRQVMALARLQQNINVNSVDVEIDKDTAGSGFGEIRKIVLLTGQNNSNDYDETVKNIKVGDISVETPDSEIKSNLGGSLDYGAGLKEMIANFYGLSVEHVEIK